MPSILSQLEDLFHETKEQFIEAERRVKLIERENFSDGINIPSINELRYAGYHLFHALSLEHSPEEQKENLERAKRHCQRASYDAMELGIIQSLEEIKVFKEDYKSIPVSDVVNNYIEILRSVQTINDFIANNNHDDRHEYYADCESHYETLRGIKTTLTHAREELNKNHNAKKFSSRTTYISIGVGALGVLVAAAALFTK